MGDQSFSIVPVTDPSTWVGANSGSDTTLDVVLGGTMKTWTGNASSGCLVLEGKWYCGYNGDNVVVSDNSSDCVDWKAVQPSPGVYVIELPDGSKVWTVGSGPGAPITLAPINTADPKSQEFQFVPVN